MDGIRRKMTKREMGDGIILVFFFFFERLLVWVCPSVLWFCAYVYFFWFGFGLCCACHIEEDGRGKS